MLRRGDGYRRRRGQAQNSNPLTTVEQVRVFHAPDHVGSAADRDEVQPRRSDPPRRQRIEPARLLGPRAPLTESQDERLRHLDHLARV
jgi:hypothetical protein